MPHDERLPLKTLAARDAVVERCVDARALTRFRRLCRSIDSVRARLSFGMEDKDDIRIKGLLTATVVVDCQRCLDPISVGLRSEFSVLAVADANDVARLADRGDLLEVDSYEPTLAELIEDELILTLPIRPCDLGNCEKAPPLAYPQNVPGKRKPFESLAALTRN